MSIEFQLHGQEYSQMEMKKLPNEEGLKFYEDMFDEMYKIWNRTISYNMLTLIFQLDLLKNMVGGEIESL